MGTGLTRVRAVLDGLVRDGVLQGAVAGVSHRGRLLVTSAGTVTTAFGDRPASSSDRFLLTSVTKPLTSAQVLLLADAGDLSLDDDVQRFVPTRDGGVSIRHLLDHTSGIAESANVIEGDAPTNATVEDLVGHAARAPLDWIPGSRTRYCSPGFWLLAEAISQSSGMPYIGHLHRAVARPLGMTATRYGADTGARDVAVARTDRKGHLTAQVVRLHYPAGGVIGTVSDILRFGSAMVESADDAEARGWMSPDMLDHLWAIPDRELGDPADEFRLGWRIHRSDAGPSLWHQGASGTMLWLDRRTHTAVAMLSADWYLPDAVFVDVALAGLADSRRSTEEDDHHAHDR